jgi:hypothetical protein
MTKKAFLYQMMLMTALVLGGAATLFNCSAVDSLLDSGARTDGGGTKFCKKDSDCDTAAKETCQSGICKVPTQSCTASNQCDGGCCSNNVCGACGGADGGGDGGGQKVCKNNEECRPNKYCKDGDCKDPGTCATSDDCPVTLACNPASKKCECADNDSCKDWPDGKTYCDPVTRECRAEKTCEDCNPACKQCADGVCSLIENKCCANEDCVQEGSYCNTDINECMVHQCSDTCATDEECMSWCQAEFGNMAYCDTFTYTCNKAECKVAPDCDPPNGSCTYSGKNTCTSDKVCQCWSPVGICKECKTDGDCDEGATPPQKCFTDPFNPSKVYCTHSCTTKTDCADTGRLIPFCFTISQMCGC